MSNDCSHVHRLKCGVLTLLTLLVVALPASAANIVVSKLDFVASSDDLKSAFEQFGQVSSARVVMSAATGKSMGFGYVEMPNDDEARAAIRGLDGSELLGTTIVVKFADAGESSGGRGTPNPGLGGGGFGRSRGGGSTPQSPGPAAVANPARAPTTPPSAPDPAPVAQDAVTEAIDEPLDSEDALDVIDGDVEDETFAGDEEEEADDMAEDDSDANTEDSVDDDSSEETFDAEDSEDTAEFEDEDPVEDSEETDE